MARRSGGWAAPLQTCARKLDTGLMGGATVAVIQARMSSSRLPGKVLMPIAGKPLLWHLVHRLRQCRTVDSIAIATSTDVRDDALEALCAQEGILCVRGSLDNVLDRYRLAAERA